jgi:hypothetical protein
MKTATSVSLKEIPAPTTWATPKTARIVRAALTAMMATSASSLGVTASCRVKPKMSAHKGSGAIRLWVTAFPKNKGQISIPAMPATSVLMA